jgi:rhodanese-related sulfurtransferase
MQKLLKNIRRVGKQSSRTSALYLNQATNVLPQLQKMENTNLQDAISVAKLSQSLIQSPDQIFLIDLMGKEEFAGSHIPGAINIPVEELQSHLSEIPKDKTVIVACRRGLMKSDMGLEELRKSGFTNSMKLEGGNTAWFNSNPPDGNH